MESGDGRTVRADRNPALSRTVNETGEPPSAARRAWLNSLEAATRRAFDHVREADDPRLQDLASDLEQLSGRLRRELDEGTPAT